MSTVLNAVREPAAPTPVTSVVRIALLGMGNVGGALAGLAARADRAHRFSIVSALVRDPTRPRAVDVCGIPLTVDPRAALASRPDVVVELLGGLEPARTIVSSALSMGLPVVTANKSLIAAHGDELFDAAAKTGATLSYEASVLAGVPFLGTFQRRPFARELTGVSGIVNGTSNFILSRMLNARLSFADALCEAQRAGFAEPDPARDVDGDDAVEKLCVLVRHFRGWRIAPADIERTTLADVELEDLQHAVTFGGRIRPVAAAGWEERDHHGLTAFAGPAFVPDTNGLSRVDGVQNALSLATRWSGTLFFSGAGAGPTVTAATVLDDVVEACATKGIRLPPATAGPPAWCGAPQTGWFLRVTSPDLADQHEAPGLLARLGVRMQRISPVLRCGGTERQWMLTHPCAREHLDAALEILAAKRVCSWWSIRAMD